MSNDKLDVEVEFSQLSIGENIASLGVKIARKDMASDEAERFLCGARLKGSIKIGDAKEPELPGVEEITPIEDTFDIRGYGANKKRFTCRLAFNVEEVDVALLSHFPNKTGKIVAEKLGDAPEKRGRKTKES